MTDDRALRLRAEALARLASRRRSLPETDADREHLLHELQVHQIELEMQAEELRRAREDADAQAARYTDLYDFAPVGYLTLDRSGTIRLVNLAGARLLGKDRERLVGRRLALFLAETDRPALAAFLEGADASSQPETWSATTVGDPPRILSFSGGLTGDRRECRVTFSDVTDRARTDQARALLDTALAASGYLVMITDRQGTIERVNVGFTRLTGYSAAEAVGRNSRDLLRSGSHPVEFYRQLWGTILAGNVWSGQITNRRKDGRLYVEERTIAPVAGTGGTIRNFVAIGHDLSAERALQEQLTQVQKIELVGQLAGGIAHDFNNLLTVINGTANLLLDSMEAQDPSRAGVTEIGLAGARAAALTGQLLAFSRKDRLKPVALDLRALVDGVMPLLRRLIGEQIAIELEGDARATVMADPRQLEQVFLNLAVNARDAMPDGGTITIRLENLDLTDALEGGHQRVDPGAYAVVTFIDTGIGMDAATVRSIFEPFFTTKGPGTGLGLATVDTILNECGGRILVESRPGQGASFRVFLPRRAEPAVPPAAPAPRPARGTETVLVVEDEEPVRHMAEAILSRLGYRVLAVPGGAEALALLARHPEPIHLVFSDTIMPGMGGLALAREVKRTHPGLKVLLTSGYSNSQALGQELADQAIPFITKPYTAVELSAKVRAIFD